MSRPFVVFDIDDTLYLERDYVRSGFRAVETFLSAPGFADCAWKLFESGVRGRTFDIALGELGMDGDAAKIAHLVEIYRDHTPDIQLLPDVRRWFVTRRASGVACISDGPLSSQQAKVDALGLSDLCETIVLTAALGSGYQKPHTRAFEQVAAATGYKASTYVYVADNPHKDFDGPRALGWRTVRVRRSGALHAEISTPQFVDAEIVDLHALDDVLDR